MDTSTQDSGFALRPRTVGRRQAPVVLYTKHKKARAFCTTSLLELQACARFVLEVLITFANPAGKSWISAREIAQVVPRSGMVQSYSLAHVRRSLRHLRDGGLLRWTRVMPGECFPCKDGEQAYQTESGGRVWEVNLGALSGTGGLWVAQPLTPRPPRPRRGSARTRQSAERGTDEQVGQALHAAAEAPARAEQEIMQDLPPPIIHDPSSDPTPSGSLDRNVVAATEPPTRSRPSGSVTPADAGGQRAPSAGPDVQAVPTPHPSSASATSAVPTPPPFAPERLVRKGARPRADVARGPSEADARQLDLLLGPGWRGETPTPRRSS